MNTARKPAIARISSHPADAIPDRADIVADEAGGQTGTFKPPAATLGDAPTERLTEQHNVRIRPSVKDRLGRAVDKLRYETGDRSISIASITDQAVDDYLTRRGC
jgi:hypothetical protein